MEATIASVISAFGPQIVLGVVTVVVTTFVMMWLRNLVVDIVNYFKSKSNSVGENAIIIYNGKNYLVQDIKFKSVKLVNGDDIMFIPMKIWINMSFTVPRFREGIDIKDGISKKL